MIRADRQRHIPDIIAAHLDALHQLRQVLDRTRKPAATAADQDREKPIQGFQLVFLLLRDQEAKRQLGNEHLQPIHCAPPTTAAAVGAGPISRPVEK